MCSVGVRDGGVVTLNGCGVIFCVLARVIFKCLADVLYRLDMPGVTLM